MVTKKSEKKEVVNIETGEILNVSKVPNGLKFQVIEENLDKWNFQETGKQVFVGFYKRTENLIAKVLNDKGEVIEKPFHLFVFEEHETEKRYSIDSCHTITKTIENEIANNTDFEKTVFMIQFLGKTILKGKPFNQFTISKATV